MDNMDQKEHMTANPTLRYLASRCSSVHGNERRGAQRWSVKNEWGAQGSGGAGTMTKGWEQRGEAEEGCFRQVPAGAWKHTRDDGNEKTRRMLTTNECLNCRHGENQESRAYNAEPSFECVCQSYRYSFLDINYINNTMSVLNWCILFKRTEIRGWSRSNICSRNDGKILNI